MAVAAAAGGGSGGGGGGFDKHSARPSLAFVPRHHNLHFPIASTTTPIYHTYPFLKHIMEGSGARYSLYAHGGYSFYKYVLGR